MCINRLESSIRRHFNNCSTASTCFLEYNGTKVAHILTEGNILRDEPCIPGKTQITHEILAYLAEHPDAQDTLEGIIQWWLLERRITYQTVMVKEALAELIEKGFIIKNKTQKMHSYKLNPHRREEVFHLLNEETGNPTGSREKGNKLP